MFAQLGRLDDRMRRGAFWGVSPGRFDIMLAMAVERHHRRLDEIVGELLAPLLHARPAAGGFRLMSWDVEQGICVTIGREGEWVLIELEDRDDTRPAYARTRWFNI